nr:hypothetical protein [Tanacetum cinerariifolium]
MDDLEPDDESVDTPLVSPFLDSNNDSDDGKVLNKLEEYAIGLLFELGKVGRGRGRWWVVVAWGKNGGKWG